MELSQKPKPFSQFFIAFLNSTSNSEYCGKKDERHSVSIFEIIDCKKMATYMSRRSCFSTPMGSQRVTGSKYCENLHIFFEVIAF